MGQKINQKPVGTGIITDAFLVPVARPTDGKVYKVPISDFADMFVTATPSLGEVALEDNTSTVPLIANDGFYATFNGDTIASITANGGYGVVNVINLLSNSYGNLFPGLLELANAAGYKSSVKVDNLSAARVHQLPNASGTLALVSQIPTYLSQLTNNMGYITETYANSVYFQLANFPTQTGHAGQYLTTNGTALSWASIDLTGYVPYIGANQALNLGTWGLLAGGLTVAVGASTNLGTLSASTSSGGRLTLDAPANVGFGLRHSGVNAWSVASYNYAGPTNKSFTIYNDQTLTTALLINGDTNGAVFSGSLTASIAARATAATVFVTHASGLLQTRTAAQVLSDIGAQASGNYVTSIGLTLPGVLYSTPVTWTVVAGAATATMSLLTQAANTVFAGPSSGINATPTFRALVAADIPALSYAPVSGSANYINNQTAITQTAAYKISGVATAGSFIGTSLAVGSTAASVALGQYVSLYVGLRPQADGTASLMLNPTTNMARGWNLSAVDNGSTTSSMQFFSWAANTTRLIIGGNTYPGIDVAGNSLITGALSVSGTLTVNTGIFGVTSGGGGTPLTVRDNTSGATIFTVSAFGTTGDSIVYVNRKATTNAAQVRFVDQTTGASVSFPQWNVGLVASSGALTFQTYNGAANTTVAVFGGATYTGFDITGNSRITGTLLMTSNLTMGTATEVATATPITIDMGATRTNTNGSNPKLKVWSDGSSSYGIGMGLSGSVYQLEYIVPNATNQHAFYVGGSRVVTISGNNANGGTQWGGAASALATVFGYHKLTPAITPDLTVGGTYYATVSKPSITFSAANQIFYGFFADIGTTVLGTGSVVYALGVNGNSLFTGAVTATGKGKFGAINFGSTVVPTSSADATGVDGDWQFDGTYVYRKFAGSWLRSSAWSTF